jgi:hypothetical protein
MRFLECKRRILDVVDSGANINLNLLCQEGFINSAPQRASGWHRALKDFLAKAQSRRSVSAATATPVRINWRAQVLRWSSTLRWPVRRDRGVWSEAYLWRISDGESVFILKGLEPGDLLGSQSRAPGSVSEI